jgi:hypothetical protein
MNDGVTTRERRSGAFWVCDVTDDMIAYVDADFRGAGVQAIGVSHEKSDVVSSVLDGLRRPGTHEPGAPGDQNLHQTRVNADRR